MIVYLNGCLVEKNFIEFVIECGGVGYVVRILFNIYVLLGFEELLKLFM